MDEKDFEELVTGWAEAEKEKEIPEDPPKLPAAPLIVRDVKSGQYVFVRYEFLVKGGFATEMPCGIGDGQVKILVMEPKVGAKVTIESARESINAEDWQEIKDRPGIGLKELKGRKDKDATFIEELKSL